ncbi:MAG: hypothetical protein ABI639_11465 [Thermoanaerobaculia bacterium]
MTKGKTDVPADVDPRLLVRILEEGYGPGAWHGPDLAAALADVPPGLAFLRPGPGRHSIAELAVHHAFYQHEVRGRLSTVAVEPFVLAGEDFFAIENESILSWSAICKLVASEQRELEKVVTATGAGPRAGGRSDFSIDERFEAVLGITCHAVYHAGQIQLIRRLLES